MGQSFRGYSATSEKKGGKKGDGDERKWTLQDDGEKRFYESRALNEIQEGIKGVQQGLRHTIVGKKSGKDEERKNFA